MAQLQEFNLNELDTRISQIWRWRAYMNLSEAEPLFYKLWNFIGFKKNVIPTLEEAKIAADKFEVKRVAALLLFQASLDRRLQKWEPWNQLMEISEVLIGDQLPFFYLCVEKSCRAMMIADHATAVKEGLLAIKCAPHFSQQVSIKLNTLLAMENLGISGESLAKELASEIEQLSLETSGPSLKTIESELAAYKKRSHFRSGNFKEFFSDTLEDNFFLEDDELKLLASQLPYHSFYKADLDLTRFLNDNFYCKNKDYKLYTLKGIRESGDQKTNRTTLSPWADRLYIWTWRWLADAKKVPVNSILEELLAEDIWNLDSRLTDTNVYMLRLVLSWLGLFDPASELQIQKLLSRIRVPSPETFKLFEAELQLIETFRYAFRGLPNEFEIARKNANELPIMKNSNLFFGNLLSLTTPDETKNPLSNLKKELWSNLSFFTSTDGTVHIDLRRSRIRNIKTQKELQSVSATRALAFLWKQKAVSCEEFARYCFDLAVYDSWTHQRRVSGLLNRIQKFLNASMQFHIRQGQILIQGTWDEFKLFGQESDLHAIADEPNWILLLKKINEENRVTTSRKEPIIPTWTGSKNWREIHLLIQGKSRSSTHRCIQEWVDEGIVTRQGQGRNTTYIVSSQNSSQ